MHRSRLQGLPQDGPEKTFEQKIWQCVHVYWLNSLPRASLEGSSYYQAVNAASGIDLQVLGSKDLRRVDCPDRRVGLVFHC